MVGTPWLDGPTLLRQAWPTLLWQAWPTLLRQAWPTLPSPAGMANTTSGGMANTSFSGRHGQHYFGRHGQHFLLRQAWPILFLCRWLGDTKPRKMPSQHPSKHALVLACTSVYACMCTYTQEVDVATLVEPFEHSALEYVYTTQRCCFGPRHLHGYS